MKAQERQMIQMLIGLGVTSGIVLLVVILTSLFCYHSQRLQHSGLKLHQVIRECVSQLCRVCLKLVEQQLVRLKSPCFPESSLLTEFNSSSPNFLSSLGFWCLLDTASQVTASRTVSLWWVTHGVTQWKRVTGSNASQEGCGRVVDLGRFGKPRPVLCLKATKKDEGKFCLRRFSFIFRECRHRGLWTKERHCLR